MERLDATFNNKNIQAQQDNENMSNPTKITLIGILLDSQKKNDSI